MSNLVEVVIEHGTARVWMNRPEVHNAFNAELIAELTIILSTLDRDSAVRVIVLSARGASFSAGADVNWMRSMAQASEQENREDALRLAKLMRTLQFLSKPTVARINGSAYGGGVGLIACCDIAIAVENAKFGLTETKLGLVPAVISPYVIAAIGLRQARRWFLTAEIFTAEIAKSIGLVHEIASSEQLDQLLQNPIEALLKVGPNAVREAKNLAFGMAHHDLEKQIDIDSANAALISRLRVSAEGQEGLSSFLEKRKPSWA